MVKKLTPEERDTLLSPLIGASWVLLQDRDAIKKTFLFKDFNEAFGFMTSVALRAERVS